MSRWPEIFATSVTLSLVMDPLGNLPVFHAVLQRFAPRRRLFIVARELIFALIILLVFLFAGTQLLRLLGLTQPSLNIAGGVLLFVIALRMVFPKSVREEREIEEDPFIVPLAMPLVAGPSTIAVLLFLSSSQPDRIWDWCVALVLAMILILIATQMLLNGIRDFLLETQVL